MEDYGGGINLNIQIEKATVEDTNELIRVQNQSFLSDYILYGICPGYGRSYDSMKKSIETCYVFKILDGDTIIGDIIVREKGNDDYYLGGLCVIPAYENKGIGHIAMKFIFDLFSDVKHWSLETPLLKGRNHYFYKKHGFEITKEYLVGSVDICLFEKFR
jgi:GNAT superfamily N-acetyltransferase